ncbi:MAG: thiamine pyrophosphate-dependent enzyme [Hyphomicrobiaceae bacterium]
MPSIDECCRKIAQVVLQRLKGIAMDGGTALVQTLIEWGVDTAFSVPGESYLPILNAIQKASNRINLITPRHESGVTFAAEAYGKINGRPAAGFVSRGPGATNASIGVHTAAQDSTPLLLFVGHVPTTTKGREAFQEVDYHQMFGRIAKAVLEPETSADVASVTARAIQISKAGRPGPVVVVMPKDVTEGDATGAQIPPPVPNARTIPDADGLASAAALIDAAERPLLVAGEMISIEDCQAELVTFAERTGVAVSTAYRRQDTFPNDLPAYVGHLEINRVAFQQRLWEDADLIVAAGARLDGISSQEFGFLRPHQKLLHIFPDTKSLANMACDLTIAADVGPTLAALAGAARSGSAARLAWRDSYHAEYDRFATPGSLQIFGALDLSAVVVDVQRQVRDDAIILTDSGTFARWVHRFYRFRHPHTQAGPMSGAMGYATPGALGAVLARPDRQVIAFVGDGGFLMSGQELTTAVQHRLPVKLVLCDNNAWGSILVSQQRRYGEAGTFGTRLQSPDFAMVAKGYGLPSFTVEKTADFSGAFGEALAADGPALVHLKLDERDVSPFTDEASV